METTPAKCNEVKIQTICNLSQCFNACYYFLTAASIITQRVFDLRLNFKLISLSSGMNRAIINKQRKTIVVNILRPQSTLLSIINIFAYHQRRRAIVA